MICPNLNNPEVKAKFDKLLSVVPEYAYYLWDKYQGEVPAKYYNLNNVISDFGNKSLEIKKIIDNSLPSEISSAVTIMEDVPLDILGREDLFLSMKEILNQNGITDELLINWAGINKATIGNVKKFTSTKQLEEAVKNVYTKKSKADYHIALKSHPLALESFNKWVKALEKYPIPFRDLMLTHAIKYLNPQRRSKYVLQLSEVALQNAYGIVVNKPHEANRIGKLYDQEVLSTLSDSVEHEPSASGKGYWVYIPRVAKGTGIKYHTVINDLSNDPTARGRFSVDWISNVEDDRGTDFFNTREQAEEYILKLPGNTVDSAKQFKANVETLRKLSPSTWCTSGSMTEYYVENYDNYLLIVDGVTVAGIEALPGSQGSSKRQVKEVTSRANNGIAPIDHLEDVIAFFEKHNLDLNNSSIKRAQQLKAQGKVDNYEDSFEYYQDPFDIDYELEPENFDDYYDAEAVYHAELEREEAVEFARGLTSVEDTLNNLNEVFRGGYFSIFSEVPSIFRNDERVARAAVLFDPYSLKDIDTTVPYYEELAVEVLTRSPHIWSYLPEEVKNLPSLLQIYRAYQEELDNELPFSKTNTNQIQGYYDPKTDKVVVVASNVTEEEAPKVAIHEVAHRGMIRMAKDLGGTKELYQVLFNSEKELMKKLPELLRRTGHRTVENLVQDYGFSLETEDGKAKLLMELAARWAETLVNKPKPSWWKQFLTSIQQWITKFTGKTLNEQEVNELVGGFVRYGSNVSQNVSTPSKLGVPELFNSTPELANAVYEATGFKQELNTKGISIQFNDGSWNIIKLNDKRIGQFRFIDNGEKDILSLSIQINEDYQNKGYGQIVHIMAADLAKKEYNKNLYSDYQNSKQEIQLLKSLAKKGYAEQTGNIGTESKEFPGTFNTKERAFRIKTSNEIENITEQQKQQAQQLYSQYLDSIFPNSKVRDVVYRATTKERADLKEKPRSKVIYTTDSKWYALNFNDFTTGVAVPMLVNTVNPVIENERKLLKKTYGKFINPVELITGSVDAVIGQDAGQKEGITIVVTNPEQIHILGSKQDIEGFKKFVAAEDTMESRVPVETIVARYLRQEISSDLVESLRNDRAFLQAQDKFQAREIAYKKILDLEKSRIGGRKSIKMEGNYIFHVNNPSSKRSYTKDQLWGYASRTAQEINSRYGLFGNQQIAWVRQAEDGTTYVELDIRTDFADNIVKVADTIAMEDTRAEFELIELQESLNKEKAAIAEKLRQGNELIIDGEVLPLNGEFAQRVIIEKAAISEADVEKYTATLNKLVSKFPGVVWKWDATIPGAGKIDMNTGVVLLNPYFINEETPWHEFGHILVRGIRQNNPELFESLKEEVIRLHEENPTMSAKTLVESLYPDYHGDKFWEEVITTELGRQAAEFTPKTGLFTKIKQFFKDLLSSLGMYGAEPRNLGDLVKSLHDPNAEFNFYPKSEELSDFMESRLLTPEQQDALTIFVKKDLNAPNEFQTAAEQIKLITEAITDSDMGRMIERNKYFGAEELRKSESLPAAGDILNKNKGRLVSILTKEDVAEAVLDFAEYVRYMTIYLNSIQRHINALQKATDIPPGKKLGDYHRAYLQAQSVKKQIDALLGVVASPDKGVFGPELRESIAAAKDNPGLFKNHPVAKALFWMQQSVNTIISEHEGLIQEPVLEELEDYFKEASENLKTVYNADIDNFISRLTPDNYSVNGQALPTDPNVRVTNSSIIGKGIDARVQVSFNDGTQREYSLNDFTKTFKLQSQAVARLINKAGNLQTEFEKNVPTKENIRKQLKDTNSAWFAAMDTASTTKNAGIQIIAAYLQGQDAEYRASLVGIRGELERLTDEVFEAQGPQLGGSIVDSKTFYKGMYREVPLYEVVDGKLVTDKIVLALNSSTDTIALRNRMTELKYIIDYSMNEIADLDPNDNSTQAQARRLAVTQKIEQASEQLKEFYAEYTERPFTDEYYQIQEQLPQDIRDRRNELYKAMAASRASFVSAEEVDYDDFQLLRSYQKELDDMESFYDTNGNLKPENSEGYRVAKAIYDWKSLRRANQVVEFPPLTQETQQLFEAALNKQKSELSAALAAATTQDERQAAYDNYNRWLDIYTRTIYKQEFYDERQAIIDQIQEILGEQGPQLKNAYESLFNLLLGKKDRDGHYKPSEINDDVRRTARAIEEEIEKIKAIDKSKSPLSKQAKEDLKYLFAELQDLQSSTNSKYYEETVASIKASLRTEITTANPTLEVDKIEKLVHRAFVSSQWFQDNHIVKTRYNKELEEMTSVYEPLYFWRVTVPNNPAYVEKEAPSFYWYTPRVSDNFKNPNYSPGNTTFKNVTSGPYYNASYANLTTQQKTVLEKLRAFYYESQEGNYSKDKPGDVLPGVYKTGGENAIDFLSRKKNPFTNIFEETKNFVLGARTAMSDVEETTFEEELDAYGNPVERESRKLFMRYSKPLPIEQQSYDLLRSIGLYAESSARFKSLRNLQSTVLAMEEVYENLSGIKEGGVVRDLVDRQFYGKVVNSPKSKVGKILNAMMNVVGRLAGSKSLAYNLISAPVNQFTGYKNNLIFTKSNGLTYGNYLAAYKETFGLSYDFFTSHNQTGMQPIRMQIVDFFGGTQSNYVEDFTKLTNRGLRKYAKFWRAVGTYREYTEYDIAAMTTFAFLDKYNVTADDGTVYKLKDAFELVNGVLSIKPNIQISPAFLQKVREDIRLANYRAQGVYDKLGQPTIAKYALVRQVLFLKKWMPQHLKTEWGGGTIHYGSGVKTIGAHRAFGRFLQETFHENGKFWTGYQNLTAAERAGLEQFGLNYGAFVMFSNVIGMMSAYLNCEDDGEANWKDYFCFFSKKISNEVEGVFTIWGANEFLFTYLRENANGIGGFEKFGWSLFGPFSVFRKFADFDGGLYNTDPYYKYRPNSSKIDWDRTHPTQAGKPGLQVLAMELLGTKGLFLGLDPQSMDYQNRAFNSYMPKTYTKDLRTRYKENYGGVEIMKTRTVGGQLKAQYKKQQKELQKKIQAYTSSGKEVPSSVYEELADLQVRFTKAVSEMDARGDTDKTYTPALFRPYFLTREGLDITEEF